MSIDIYSRWFHVWFAGLLLGGTVFQWFALSPAVKDLTDQQKPLFREWVNARWRIAVMVSSLILLATVSTTISSCSGLSTRETAPTTC